MCRPIRDHRRRRPRDLNRSWDDVLAHICLPTIPAKLSAQVSAVLHSSISREDARAWNYNGIDRNGTRERKRRIEKESEMGSDEGRRGGKDDSGNPRSNEIGQTVKMKRVCTCTRACVCVCKMQGNAGKTSNVEVRNFVDRSESVRLNSRDTESLCFIERKKKEGRGTEYLHWSGTRKADSPMEEEVDSPQLECRDPNVRRRANGQTCRPCWAQFHIPRSLRAAYAGSFALVIFVRRIKARDSTASVFS